jgi:hypothetical protein
MKAIPAAVVPIPRPMPVASILLPDGDVMNKSVEFARRAAPLINTLAELQALSPMKTAQYTIGEFKKMVDQKERIVSSRLIEPTRTSPKGFIHHALRSDTTIYALGRLSIFQDFVSMFNRLAARGGVDEVDCIVITTEHAVHYIVHEDSRASINVLQNINDHEGSSVNSYVSISAADRITSADDSIFTRSEPSAVPCTAMRSDNKDIMRILRQMCQEGWQCHRYHRVTPLHFWFETTGLVLSLSAREPGQTNGLWQVAFSFGVNFKAEFRALIERYLHHKYKERCGNYIIDARILATALRFWSSHPRRGAELREPLADLLAIVEAAEKELLEPGSGIEILESPGPGSMRVPQAEVFRRFTRILPAYMEYPCLTITRRFKTTSSAIEGGSLFESADDAKFSGAFNGRLDGITERIKTLIEMLVGFVQLSQAVVSTSSLASTVMPGMVLPNTPFAEFPSSMEMTQATSLGHVGLVLPAWLPCFPVRYRLILNFLYSNPVGMSGIHERPISLGVIWDRASSGLSTGVLRLGLIKRNQYYRPEPVNDTLFKANISASVYRAPNQWDDSFSSVNDTVPSPVSVDILTRGAFVKDCKLRRAVGYSPESEMEQKLRVYVHTEANRPLRGAAVLSKHSLTNSRNTVAEATGDTVAIWQSIVVHAPNGTSRTVLDRAEQHENSTHGYVVVGLPDTKDQMGDRAIPSRYPLRAQRRPSLSGARCSASHLNQGKGISGKRLGITYINQIIGHSRSFGYQRYTAGCIFTYVGVLGQKTIEIATYDEVRAANITHLPSGVVVVLAVPVSTGDQTTSWVYKALPAFCKERFPHNVVAVPDLSRLRSLQATLYRDSTSFTVWDLEKDNCPQVRQACSNCGCDINEVREGKYLCTCAVNTVVPLTFNSRTMSGGAPHLCLASAAGGPRSSRRQVPQLPASVVRAGWGEYYARPIISFASPQDCAPNLSVMVRVSRLGASSSQNWRLRRSSSLPPTPEAAYHRNPSVGDFTDIIHPGSVVRDNQVIRLALQASGCYFTTPGRGNLGQFKKLIKEALTATGQRGNDSPQAKLQIGPLSEALDRIAMANESLVARAQPLSITSEGLGLTTTHINRRTGSETCFLLDPQLEALVSFCQRSSPVVVEPARTERGEVTRIAQMKPSLFRFAKLVTPQLVAVCILASREVVRGANGTDVRVGFARPQILLSATPGSKTRLTTNIIDIPSKR